MTSNGERRRRLVGSKSTDGALTSSRGAPPLRWLVLLSAASCLSVAFASLSPPLPPSKSNARDYDTPGLEESLLSGLTIPFALMGDGDHEDDTAADDRGTGFGGSFGLSDSASERDFTEDLRTVVPSSTRRASSDASSRKLSSASVSSSSIGETSSETFFYNAGDDGRDATFYKEVTTPPTRHPPSATTIHGGQQQQDDDSYKSKEDWWKDPLSMFDDDDEGDENNGSDSRSSSGRSSSSIRRMMDDAIQEERDAASSMKDDSGVREELRDYDNVNGEYPRTPFDEEEIKLPESQANIREKPFRSDVKDEEEPPVHLSTDENRSGWRKRRGRNRRERSGPGESEDESTAPSTAALPTHDSNNSNGGLAVAAAATASTSLLSKRVFQELFSRSLSPVQLVAVAVLAKSLIGRFWQHRTLIGDIVGQDSDESETEDGGTTSSRGGGVSTMTRSRNEKRRRDSFERLDKHKSKAKRDARKTTQYDDDFYPTRDQFDEDSYDLYSEEEREEVDPFFDFEEAEGAPPTRSSSSRSRRVKEDIQVAADLSLSQQDGVGTEEGSAPSRATGFLRRVFSMSDGSSKLPPARKLVEQLADMTDRLQQAERSKYTVETEYEKASFELKEAQSELSSLKETTRYLQAQLRDNEEMMERVVKTERRKAKDELARLKDAMVKVVEREREAMRNEFMKQASELEKRQQQQKKHQHQRQPSGVSRDEEIDDTEQRIINDLGP